MKRTSSIFSNSLCIHFRPLLGKVSKQFLCKYQYSCILIFSVLWLGTIRLKYTVIVLRLIWEFRWYKQKANRITEILFLLLTLLTIYPYMLQSNSFKLEQFTTHLQLIMIDYEVKRFRSWNFPLSFEIVGWNITHDFVYFSDLEQLAAWFLATDISCLWGVFHSNSS